MSTTPTTSMYTVLDDAPFSRSASPSPTVIRYRHSEESRSLPGHIIMPHHRSAGIGGYSQCYSPSGIGGHVHGQRDMGIGKACLGDCSPRISPASRSASRSASPALRSGLASFKRVLSFGSLSGAKEQ
ncbi:hypothetical protein LPJ53_001048 [Coemansia erecta]|uniref:Uncharacterized protein n=1 Tax=Coemansia erecta TaxID=147472 RepID=A0A9W7Y528_9FUNG|nr:hypothetical protein LPJ53_001048 [Coemansia erecta]